MAAWPTLMPPSLAGTTEWTSTCSPAASSSASTISVSRAFWNTPPVSATVSRPRARAGSPPRRRWPDRSPRGSRPRSAPPAPRGRGRPAAGRPASRGRAARARSPRADATVVRVASAPRPGPPRGRGPPARSPPAPRSSRGAGRPRSAATASNRRPMLVVDGGDPARPGRARRCERGSSRPGSAPSTAARPRAFATHTAAIRHGSRMAAAPPGIATATRCPTRSKPARSATSTSPPHIVPSGP